MATNTPNIGLKKPNAEDFYNIADFNGNADILDTEIVKKVNKVTGGTEGNLVKLDANGDISDSGKSADDLTNTINTVNDLEEAFKEYIQEVGGFKKYTEVGTYTFKVPKFITSIKVSAIGGGGGGASGATGGGGANNHYASAGGGGGGRGTDIIDKRISVTPGETLTVIVGEGGSGANGVTYSSDNPYGRNGNNGSSGTSSYVKRNTTILITANAGTGGKYGKPSNETNGHSFGGYGGSLDGGKAPDISNSHDVGGEGGKGATYSKFGTFGNGGNGSAGGRAKGSSSNASPGIHGAVAICYGNSMNFEYIKW